MAEKKTRATRASSPRYTALSRSVSPEQHKKSKIATGDARSTAKKSAKSKAIIPNEDVEEINHDLCDACQGTGQFLCCEGCPNVFHFACVDPPMDFQEVEQLEGEWFCNQCLYRRKKTKTLSISAHQPKKCESSLFEVLIEDLETRNPVAFALPESIRNYFDGVSTGPHGAYIDATTVKTIRYRNGRPEEQDYHRLKDKNGDFIYCYWCYRTALKKPMISCDFCPLYWHLDCLNPPLTIPPSIAKKWKCPCHAQHHIRYRTPRNSTTTENDNQLVLQPPSISSALLNDFSRYKTVEPHSDGQNDNIDDVTSNNSNNNNSRSSSSSRFNNDQWHHQQISRLQQQSRQTYDDFKYFNLDSLDAYPFIQKSFGNNFMSSSNKLLTKKERKQKRNGNGSNSGSGGLG